MAELIGPLPDLLLDSGMQVVVEAIDPSTGAAVTGVKISKLAIRGDTASGPTTVGGGVAPVADVAPEFVPVPLADLNP